MWERERDQQRLATARDEAGEPSGEEDPANEARIVEETEAVESEDPLARAQRERQRSSGGSTRCIRAFTRLTMIAPSTPHQNVLISKSGTTQSVT